MPAPDLVIQLDIDPALAAQRAGYGDERYERLEFQSRVRKGFTLIREWVGKDKWVIVDASQPVENVAKDIEQAVIRCIKERNASVPRPVLSWSAK